MMKIKVMMIMSSLEAERNKTDMVLGLTDRITWCKEHVINT